MITCLNKDILQHSQAVAELMLKISNREDMYILGLLHDIGKLQGMSNHAENGAVICRKLGFKFDKEIMYHGKMQADYDSYELNLLNMADLTVDNKGNVVGYSARIENIGERYGKQSSEYLAAKELANNLKEKGFCYMK